MDDHGRSTRLSPKSWGAHFIRAGEARFRIWAPHAHRIALRLNGVDMPMHRTGDGWFDLDVSGAEPGQSYGFVLPDGLAVPDPASRAQAGDVHGPSVLVDPASHAWRHADWSGRPWREAVIYEVHIGTFTPQGTFRAAAERLGYLAKLGVTALEIMPVAQFSGTRGWGYDGVLPYAPHSAYGTPDDLKRLVDEAHGHGLMVLLDVVYNHFGPDGNYLPVYAADFFDPQRHTPWGAAIAYERPEVRSFFIDNACYWLDEFKLDGLRFDAVDQIRDPSEPELLVEIARCIRDRFPDRHIHLMTEDNRNITRLHERRDGRVALHTAEWNDDFHNAAHVLLTQEVEGYYQDFADDTLKRLATCLAEGFAYQGEPSRHAGGTLRGEPSSGLPATAFVDFLQNHDQIGNRALGERLTVMVDDARLAALTAILLLSPHIPLVFMGDEWGETRPFCFFTDFHGELADAVREGRRREFATFSAFDTKAERETIPDPNAPGTFEASRLDWAAAHSPAGEMRRETFAALLSLRRDRIVDLLDDIEPTQGEVLRALCGVLAVDWHTPGGRLQLRANLADVAQTVPSASGEVLFSTAPEASGPMPPWHVVVALQA
jgi:maltooligosyltrehalose trehalohydrolase